MSGGEPEQNVSREVSGSRKTSGALSGRSWSGKRRSQKWAFTLSAKQPAPFRCNALHRSNRVSAEKITTGVLYIFVYSHKVQPDSTTTKQS